MHRWHASTGTGTRPQDPEQPRHSRRPWGSLDLALGLGTHGPVLPQEPDLDKAPLWVAPAEEPSLPPGSHEVQAAWSPDPRGRSLGSPNPDCLLGCSTTEEDSLPGPSEHVTPQPTACSEAPAPPAVVLHGQRVTVTLPWPHPVGSKAQGSLVGDPLPKPCLGDLGFIQIGT